MSVGVYVCLLVCIILLQGHTVYLHNRLTLGGFTAIRMLAFFAVQYKVFSCQGDYRNRLCMSSVIEHRDIIQGVVQVSGDSKNCQDECCLIKEFSVPHLVCFLAMSSDLIELIQVKQCPFELMLKSLRWLSIHHVSKDVLRLNHYRRK